MPVPYQSWPRWASGLAGAGFTTLARALGLGFDARSGAGGDGGGGTSVVLEAVVLRVFAGADLDADLAAGFARGLDGAFVEVLDLAAGLEAAAFGGDLGAAVVGFLGPGLRCVLAFATTAKGASDNPSRLSR